MKATATFGAILIGLGVLALVYRGITYTENETLFKVGPIEAQAETEQTLSLPPVLGIVAVLGGVILIGVGMRRR
ncbi:MAG: hypothetical protein O3A96_14140 [Proteobacteria bacterium]|nr:hypothetical protein [Pseudomonadota bacterium]